MKTSRIAAATVAMLAMFAAVGCDDGTSQDTLNGGSDRFPQRGESDNSPASDPDSKGGSTTPSEGKPVDTKAPTAPAPGQAPVPGAPQTPAPGTGTPLPGGNTAVLNTYSKVWVTGDDKGPNRIGKNTGAGTMDASFAWDDVAFKKDPSQVLLATAYTRSDNQQNNNNSYMQGGVAFSKLTKTGVVPSTEIALPRLTGERTFMRPIVGMLGDGRAIVIAASEDNGINNNPQPVAYVVKDGSTAPLAIPNNTRGANNATKPTNLIQQALKNGIQVQNANNQRGPHTIARVNDNTFVVGMQYNNQAQEAFSVTVNADNSIKMNWLVRYSNTAQHCRPQVAIAPGATTGYIAAVEANNQPAEIGFRVTEFNVTTGRPVQSKIAIRSQPNQNKYVSEPVMGILGDKLAITYGWSQMVRANNNGNGHAGGKKIDAAVLLNKADLSVVGAPALGVGQYGRHGSSFITNYGPNAEPSLAVISGSSTGTGAGFIQMYPLKADGTLGIKDAAKVYTVSQFSDVANVQARGKRNPNNQARGFINGLGSVPNPGYTTDPNLAATQFMPEVKSFSFSTVTGYSGADAMGKGLKNSIWLSLVPAAWTEGLQTIPGKPTDKPGTNTADGTGPAPRTTGAGTDPSAEGTNSPGGDTDVVPDGDDKATHPKAPQFDSNQGCAAAPSTSTSGSLGLVGLALAGVMVARRRRQPRREA